MLIVFSVLFVYLGLCVSEYILCSFTSRSMVNSCTRVYCSDSCAHNELIYEDELTMSYRKLLYVNC